MKQIDGLGPHAVVSGSFASDCARCVKLDLIIVFSVASVNVSVAFSSCDTVFLLCNFKTFRAACVFCFWRTKGETNPAMSDIFLATSSYLG